MPEKADSVWRQKFVSDLFHSINQPLAGLHCLLEYAQSKPDLITAATVRDALRLCDEVIDRTAWIRTSMECEAYAPATPVDIAALLREVIEDFAPVLEEKRCPVEIPEGVALVLADPRRTRAALFRLVDACVADLQQDTLRVGFQRDADRIAVSISPISESPDFGMMSPPPAHFRNRILAELALRSHGCELAHEDRCLRIRFPRSARGAENLRR